MRDADPGRPRVLHLAQPTDGGVARCVVDLAADQTRRGWQVTVGCPEGGILAAELATAGVARVRWDAARAGRSATPEQRRALRALVEELDPDLVHLHSASAGLTGRLVLRGKRPTVFQPHGWSWQAVSGAYATTVRWWERLGARWAHALVCVSEAERVNGERAGVRGRFVVVPNGVDLSRFPSVSRDDQRTARSTLGLRDVPTALCVGRFDVQKGHATVLRAWREVVSALPAARLLLVGSGAEEGALRALCAELGVAESVHFAGERADMPNWYAASDLLVFASLWGEGMALTPLEAMATGRPVIASSVAGVAESVAAGCGQLVAPGDAGGFAHAMTRRLSDLSLAAAEGAAARAHAERRLDVRLSHDRIAQLCADLLEQRAR